MVKSVVGHAKNETYELVFGNFLIGIGGYLMGVAFNDNALNYLVVSAIPIFIAGIILDVRVLRKFSFEMSNVKQSILNQMNAINRNIDDIEKTKNSVENTHSKIIKTNNEIDRTQLYLDSTMSDLKKAKNELEKLEMEFFPDNRMTNPDLFNRRFESVENYTMFDMDKQPILYLYKQLIFGKPQSNLKSIQDFKLMKLLSLVYKLIWYNNSLLQFNGSRLKFEPLITLMKKKNRLQYLCALKIYESAGEISLEFEQKLSDLVANCYNSMIDSQVMEISNKEPDMEVKEHFVKVSDVNERFKELFTEINDDFLTIKFPNEVSEKICGLKLSI